MIPENNTAPAPLTPLLTITELAEQLQISVSSIYHHRSLGHSLPPAVRVGGQLRWRIQDVEDWLSDQLEQAA